MSKEANTHVSSKGASTRRWRRVPFYIAVVTLAAYGVYLVGVNLFLTLDGLQLLFKTTNQVNAVYRRAYTVWPGVVHVRDLRVTFQDRNVEFSLDLDSARVKIVLWELAKRRFHATRVEGSGVAFRLRHRIDPFSKDEPWVTALPPIPEFPSPAVFEATVPEPPVSDEKYELWTVHLEHVDVRVREIWAQFVRFQGTASVRGAFRLVPARRLWVGPAVLTIENGPVSFGKESIASNLHGTLDCHVDSYDVRVPHGREVLRMISATIALQAAGFLFDPFMQFALPKDTRARSTPGRLATDIHIRRGRLLEGARATYSTSTAYIAKGRAHVTISNLHVEPLMQAHARLRTPIEFEKIAIESSPPILLYRSTAILEVEGDDASADFAVVSKELDVPRFEMEDARSIAQLAPGSLPLTFDGGTITGGLRARDDSKALTADLDATLIDLQPRLANVGAAVDGRLHTRFSKGHQDSILSFAADGELTRSRVLVTHKGRKALPATLGQASIHANFDSRHDQLDGTLDVRVASFAVGVAGESTARVIGKGLALRGRATGSLQHVKASLGLDFESVRLRSSRLDLGVKPSIRMVTSDFDVIHRAGEIGATLRFHGWNESYGDDGGQCSSLTMLDAGFSSTSRLSNQGLTGNAQATIQDVAFAWGKDFKARANLQLSSSFAVPTSAQSSPASFLFSARVLNAEAESGERENQGWKAASPEVLLRGRLSGIREFRGDLTARITRANGRIGHVTLAAAARADVRVPHLDFRTGELEFDGTLGIEHLALNAGSREVREWRASINVGEARLIAKQNLDIEARFDARLSDATPALAVLESEGKVPGWLASVVPLRQLSTNGTVERHCRLTRIQFARAAGGPLLARGTLLSTSEDVRGSFLVRLSALKLLSAGVNVGSPDAGISPLVGDAWLDENSTRLDSSARRILSAPCKVEPQRCVGNGLDVDASSPGALRPEAHQ